MMNDVGERAAYDMPVAFPQAFRRIAHHQMVPNELLFGGEPGF